jgi:hypothetical protein
MSSLRKFTYSAVAAGFLAAPSLVYAACADPGHAAAPEAAVSPDGSEALGQSGMLGSLDGEQTILVMPGPEEGTVLFFLVPQGMALQPDAGDGALEEQFGQGLEGSGEQGEMAGADEGFLGSGGADEDASLSEPGTFSEFDRNR